MGKQWQGDLRSVRRCQRSKSCFSYENLQMADKPGFVGDANIAGVHFSRMPITRHLKQPTRRGVIRTKSRHSKVPPLLLGFAPNGVYLAGSVTRSAGALLPHRFSLTRKVGRSKPANFASLSSQRNSIRAVCFLLHLPYPRGRWTLSTIAFSGARTFLSVKICKTNLNAANT